MLFYACDGSSSKNRLSNSSSPYLRQHADNPVNWYEWGDEALERASAENKPLLISIGYASCHWCHVMEKESFMDKEVARMMNEHFICIKVDREERPDIDNIYMDACQLITGGGGGWPLNAFALPDGRPFFAGTYYPKGNWLNLLSQIAGAYKDQFSKVKLQAQALTDNMMEFDKAFIKADQEGSVNFRQQYRDYADRLYTKTDSVAGGLKGVLKFPIPALWEFLLQYHYFTNDPQALNMVKTTLVKMASGGIYDQVGGGFARYATDNDWHIPHFEKMLYDNGQLMSLYAHAFQVTGMEMFKNIVYETAAFMERDLVSPEGGFYSSLNAVTEEGEGSFYSWTPGQLNSVLGEARGKLIAEYFHVSEEGNWEDHKNILYTDTDINEFAVRKRIAPGEFREMLQTAKKVLLAERNKRKKPSTDKKILTSWNALAILGYLEAYCAFSEPAFLNTALKAASFLEKKMIKADGHLWRNSMEGKSSVSGFLDDYALLSKAFIRLYQVTFDKHWLDLAQRITRFVVKNYFDESSGFFFFTSSSGDKLVVRKQEIQDHAMPSSNAVMAEVLYALGVYFEQDDYLEIKRSMIGSVTGHDLTLTPYYASWYALAGQTAYGTHEVAILGKDALLKNIELQKNYLPECLWMGETEKENLPLLEYKLVTGSTKIYVCTDRVCKLPVEDAASALKQIRN